MDANTSREASNSSASAIEKAKRQTVPAGKFEDLWHVLDCRCVVKEENNLLKSPTREPLACQTCRQKKAKCDAQRPCSNCQRRGSECVYTTRDNETPRQAAKRKHDQVSQSNSDLAELYHFVAATKSERAASEVFNKIRQGDSLEAVLRFAKQGIPGDGDNLVHGYERRLKQDFLVHLVRTNSPLGDVVGVATKMLSGSSRITLPDRQAFLALRGKVIDLEVLSGLTRRANIAQKAIDLPDSSGDTPAFLTDGGYDGPLYWVPAAPWTMVTGSDAAVSHLVSLFLAFLSPAFRHIEEDLFLRDMRSKDLASQYCTPMLVNSILAMASAHSDSDEAYSVPGERTTRGEHFRKEALRLWSEEEGAPTIANMQALAILAQATSNMGKDRYALTLIMTAARMSLMVPIPTMSFGMTIEQREHVRARQSAAWSVAHLEAGYVMGLLQPAETFVSQVSKLPDPREAFPDKLRYWIGYPLRQDQLPFRSNQLFYAMCELTRFTSEIIWLVLSDRPKGQDYQRQAVSLITRLGTWYDDLPEALQYRQAASMPILELHASYHCACMMLYTQLVQALYGAIATSPETSHVAESYDGLAYRVLTAKALGFAYSAATSSRHFRETYGLSIFTPWTFMQTVSGAFILLKDMESGSGEAVQPSVRPDPITTTDEAFEECFRLILAYGMQLMLPRALARMIYQSARAMNVRLPAAVVSMLGVIADSAWQPSDIENINSVFPNWTLTEGSKVAAASYAMEDILRRWEGMEISEDASAHQPSVLLPNEDVGGAA